MKCPLRIGAGISGADEECVEECAWLMGDLNDGRAKACAVAVLAMYTGEQMYADDVNSYVIENEVNG